MALPPTIAAIALLLASGAGAQAACLPGSPRGCVDLNLVPQITQQIVANEPGSPGAKPAAVAEPAAQPHYTGPTVGLTDTVRRTPTIGYRWSLE